MAKETIRECTREELWDFAVYNLGDFPAAQALVKAQVDLTHLLGQEARFLILGRESYPERDRRLVIISGTDDESVRLGWLSEIIPTTSLLGHVTLARRFSKLSLHSVNVKHLVIASTPGIEGSQILEDPLFYAIGSDDKYVEGKRKASVTLHMDALDLTPESFLALNVARSAIHAISIKYQEALQRMALVVHQAI